MRGLFILIIFLLGFFILFTGTKIVEERVKTIAEIEKAILLEEKLLEEKR